MTDDLSTIRPDGSLDRSAPAAPTAGEPPLRPLPPVRMQAVDALRSDIVSGRLPAGSRLIERELTESLAVSRNTLREAFRQLESEGFLEIRPRRGPTVASLDRQAVSDLYEVRQVLECLAVRLFTSRASDHQLERLIDAFDAFAEAVASGETAQIVGRKDAFYDLLYAGAGNRDLHAQARTLYGRLAGLRLQTLSVPERGARSLREISGVIAVMKARHPDRAAALWKEHIHMAAAAALSAVTPEGTGTRHTNTG